MLVVPRVSRSSADSDVTGVGATKSLRATRDPLTVTMPKPEPLAGSALVAFRAATAPALAQLKRVEGVRLAAR